MDDTWKSLVDIQEASCSKFASRPMYGTKREDGYVWTTFSEFARMTDEIRGGLAALEVGPGDRVAVIANNSVEWAASAYATYGRRAQYVPMYETQSVEDWRYILRDSGAKVLFAREQAILERVGDSATELPDLEHRVLLDGEHRDAIALSRLRVIGRENPAPALRPDPEDPFGLIYTSGTTGKPKGVLLTHQNLMAELRSVGDLVDFGPDDRSLSFLPWGHLMGQIEEVHFLILKGFSAALVPDVKGIAEDFQQIRPTVLFAVPLIFNRIYDGVTARIRERGGFGAWLFERGRQLSRKRRRGERLDPGERVVLGLARQLVFKKVRRVFGGRLRLAISGGAALSLEVAELVDDLGVCVIEGYGMTETTMAVTANSLEDRRLGSVGKPVSGAKVVLDTSVPSGSPDEGEIIVYGPHIAAGYNNLTELFAECLTEDGGFRTGDLGRFEDGYLYITGRVKELYKLANGKYIAPAPVEERLKESAYISQAMLFGEGRPYDVAVVVPELAALSTFATSEGIDTAEPDWIDNPKIHGLLEQEMDRLGAGFAAYARPRRFAVVTDDWTPENGLLTPTLKIKRPLLAKKYQAVIEGLYAT